MCNLRLIHLWSYYEAQVLINIFGLVEQDRWMEPGRYAVQGVSLPGLRAEGGAGLHACRARILYLRLVQVRILLHSLLG